MWASGCREVHRGRFAESRFAAEAIGGRHILSIWPLVIARDKSGLVS